MRLQHPFEIITPTLDGEILSVLAGADDWFSVNTIHELLSHRSDEGIRKTLKRLVSVGIADELGAGRAFLYRLNRDHLGAEAIIVIARLKQLFYTKLTEMFLAWEIQPRYVALFGSAARAQMNLESDVDILLVQPDDAIEHVWDEQINQLVLTASRWIGNEIRPLLYTESDVRTLGTSEPVFEFISTEGIPLLGDHHNFQRLMRNRN